MCETHERLNQLIQRIQFNQLIQLLNHSIK